MASPTLRVAFPGRSFSASRQARIYTAGVGTLVFPWWPTGGQIDGLADTFQTVDRPGRRPVQVRTGRALPSRTYNLLVSSTDVDQSVESWISALLKHAAATNPTRVLEASRDRGAYQITGLSYTAAEHNSAGAVTTAQVDVTFTVASTADVVVGPVTARKKKATTPAKKPASKKHPSTVRYGSRGSTVELLQRALNSKNGARLKVDGVFGPAVLAAVRAWQRKKKLTVDGIAGPNTWSSLGY